MVEENNEKGKGVGGRNIPTYILIYSRSKLYKQIKKLRIKVLLEKEVRRLTLCKNSLK